MPLLPKMKDHTADAFVIRDEPLPLLTVTNDDLDPSSDETDSSRISHLRHKVSHSRLAQKAREIHASHAQKAATNPTGKPALQDRLFDKILEQVIPIQTQDEAEEATKVDRRSSEYVTRPGFSLTVMSNKFRRFNARIGIVFVFQNRLIRLFTWRTTTHTLSFLAAYTFVCLDPYLLLVLPLAAALLFVMVPAFIARHPPPTITTKSFCLAIRSIGKPQLLRSSNRPSSHNPTSSRDIKGLLPQHARPAKFHV